MVLKVKHCCLNVEREEKEHSESKSTLGMIVKYLKVLWIISSYMRYV